MKWIRIVCGVEGSLKWKTTYFVDVVLFEEFDTWFLSESEFSTWFLSESKFGIWYCQERCTFFFIAFNHLWTKNIVNGEFLFGVQLFEKYRRLGVRLSSLQKFHTWKRYLKISKLSLESGLSLKRGELIFTLSLILPPWIFHSI